MNLVIENRYVVEEMQDKMHSKNYAMEQIVDWDSMILKNQSVYKMNKGDKRIMEIREIRKIILKGIIQDCLKKLNYFN